MTLPTSAREGCETTLDDTFGENQLEVVKGIETSETETIIVLSG